MKDFGVGPIIAFVAIALAIIVGIIEATGIMDITEYGATVATILVIAGVLIGLINITSAESTSFMIAALVIAGGTAVLTFLPYVGEGIQIVFGRVATLVIPAAIVVAIVTAYTKMK